MKTILISILLLTNFIFAGALSLEGNLAGLNGSKIMEKTKNKTYKELISALEIAPNGEYAFYLAIIYTNGMSEPDSVGDTVEKDKGKALLFFNKSIELGYYNAAQVLGSLYVYHEDFITESDNILKAERFLKLSIENGSYEGTTILADIYMNYLDKPQKGIDILIVGAENGISGAQLMLAIIYNWGVNKDKNGFEVKQDKMLAQMLITKACTNKNKTKKVIEFCSSKSIKKTNK